MLRHHSFAVLFLGMATGPLHAQTSVLEQRDAAYKHGRILYHLDFPSRTHANGKVDRASVQDGALTFVDDGRYLLRTVDIGGAIPELVSTTMVKGKGWAYTEEAFKSYTQASFSDESAFLIGSPEQFLTLEPCAPLGLGLSDKRPVSREVRPSGETVIRAGDVQLILGSRGEPRSYTKLRNGSTYLAWKYSGLIQASPQLVVPMEATFSAPAVGIGHGQTYRFKSVDFVRVPRSDELTTRWFRAGVTVVDRRVDPVATWTYDKLVKANGGKTELTPQRLLELSQGLSGFFKREEARKLKLSEPSKSSLWLPIAYIGIPIMAVGAYLLSRRQRRGR